MTFEQSPLQAARYVSTGPLCESTQGLSSVGLYAVSTIVRIPAHAAVPVDGNATARLDDERNRARLDRAAIADVAGQVVGADILDRIVVDDSCERQARVGAISTHVASASRCPAGTKDSDSPRTRYQP